jgi:hypothetical protein
MADITYTRTFAHNDWIDGESIVQAAGENGFNTRFHACEKEFDNIAGAFGQVNTALKNLQQLRFLVSQPTLSIGPNSSSPEFEVEIYDRAPLPANIDKTYFCVILPVTGLNIMHTFLYRQIPGNKVRVTIAFFNPTAAAVSFAYRILALAEQ